jgi:flagellar M-ring protein FliF
MGDWLKAYIEQLKDLWNNLNNRAKLVIGLGVVGVFFVLVFIIIWSGSNIHYQTLFSQLQPRDADAIIKRLDEEGIPYRLTDDGQTIMVSSDIVHKTRLEMAGVGLPSQGVVGFEIFDQSSFGTTDFERKVNFYRALSGELSRSIQAMDGVDYARVQITAPKESLFIEEEEPAEASVLLRLASGFRLDQIQIRAITNLVASSVQGLTPDRVTVVDTAGNLYTRNFNDNNLLTGQLALNHFEIERQFEEGLKSDLRSMLTKILGPDNYTVQVKVSLNFDQREVESKEYYPVVGEEGIVRSRQEQVETYQGEDGSGGVPGTTSNTPRYEIIENTGESGTYESSNIVTNYEINEKIERHVYAPGEVERIAVAVVINEAMDQENLDKIEQIVRTAINYNSDRGDNVTVTGLPFDDTLEREMTAAVASAESARRTQTYIYAGLIGLIFIILFSVFMVLRKTTEPVGEDIVPGKAVDYLVEDEIEKEVAVTAAVSEQDLRRQKLRETIADIVTEKPEEVAQLLKSWLLDE